MFRFFKKKAAEKHPANTKVSPQKPSRVDTKVILTLDDVDVLADAMFKGNAHASVYVAQCGGFPLGPLDTSRFSEYWSLALSAAPEDFSEEDKLNATRYRIKEFVDSLSSDYSLLDYSGHSHAVRLDKIKHVICDIDTSTQAFEALGLNEVADVFLKRAMRKKQHDLERVILELRDREEYVRRTFLPLQRNRLNKYGDIDLTNEINEIDDFIDHFFDRESFDYFYTVSPAALIVHYIESMLDDVIDMTVTPVLNPTFVTLSDGSIRNTYDILLLNKHGEDRPLRISVTGHPALRVQLEGKPYETVHVAATQTYRQRVYVVAASGSDPARDKRSEIRFWVEDLTNGDCTYSDTIFNGRSN